MIFTTHRNSYVATKDLHKYVANQCVYSCGNTHFSPNFWTARPLEQLFLHFVELCCHIGQSEFDMDVIFTERALLSENSGKE